MALNLPIYIVDAFTTEAFRGNPAAVCLLENARQLETSDMQSIAKEMNLSETAFVYPLHDEAEKYLYHLRWFTPTTEVPLCGHATLATAHILLTERHVGAEEEEVVLRFRTLGGELRVKSTSPSHKILEMNFPLGHPEEVSLSEEVKEELLSALGTPAGTQIVDSALCRRTRKLLLQVQPASAILCFDLNSDSLQRVEFDESIKSSVKGVIATASTVNDPEDFQNCDFVSRYFAPWVGIPEDPVTGSAHTVLARYWSERKELLRAGAGGSSGWLKGFQASPGRGGIVRVLCQPETDRVLLRGNAVTVLRGTFSLPQEDK